MHLTPLSMAAFRLFRIIIVAMCIWRSRDVHRICKECESPVEWTFVPFCRSHLLEPDVLRLLSKRLARHVQAVLANDTGFLLVSGHSAGDC